MLYSKATSYQQ